MTGEKQAIRRIGVAGLGVVGEGAALDILQDDRLLLVGALVRDRSKKRHAAIDPDLIVDDAETLFEAAPEIIVDAMSDGAAGRRLVDAALGKGVSVVTANKQAVAGAIGALHEKAARNGAAVAYSASVGGGAPMVETLRAVPDGAKIVEIKAILNGTVNFILSELGGGANFDDAVKAAQDAGFAEADPSADLSGLDARAKIAILSYEAFGAEPILDEIAVEGLDSEKATGFANGPGAWRQISRVSQKDGVITARVAYEDVTDDPLFAKATGVDNAMRAIAADGAVFEASGKGAGRGPTVSSVFADLDALLA